MVAVESKLRALWDAAVAQNREDAWAGLPDLALDVCREQGVTSEDLVFLVGVVNKSWGCAATTAVRTLACLGEERLVPTDVIRALFASFIESCGPAVRIAVAEGLWQMAETSATALLRCALAREANKEVRDTMVHVLGLFAKEIK